MSHDALRQALSAYRLRYTDEGPVVDRVIDLLVTQPACFERNSFDPGHITGSAWLVDSTGERVLLTHHKKLDRWLQLGGHADGDEDVLRVALREAKEESGVACTAVEDEIFDVDIHVIPARGEDPAHYHFDLRFALRANQDEFRVSAESHALRWVDIALLASVTAEPSMLRMAAKWRAHRRGR